MLCTSPPRDPSNLKQCNSKCFTVRIILEILDVWNKCYWRRIWNVPFFQKDDNCLWKPLLWLEACPHGWLASPFPIFVFQWCSDFQSSHRDANKHFPIEIYQFPNRNPMTKLAIKNMIRAHMFDTSERHQWSVIRELVMACEVLLALVDIFFVLQDWVFDLMIAFLFAE